MKLISKNKIREILILTAGSLAVITLDQLSKFLMIKSSYKSYFFHLVGNTGAGFSILKGQRITLIILSIIIMGSILYFYVKDLKYSYSLWIGFIIGGALSNLYDRLFRGYVVDFIDLKVWPIFNLSDLFIVFGAFYIVYSIYSEDIRKFISRVIKPK